MSSQFKKETWLSPTDVKSCKWSIKTTKPTSYQDYRLETLQTSLDWLLLPMFLEELAVWEQHVAADPDNFQRSTLIS